MSPAILQRAGWLAAVALVVGVGALALSRRDAGGSHRDIPGAVTVRGSGSGYYTARVAPYGPTRSHRRTACGDAFTASTQGLAHPVLPCGVKIYIRYHGREVLTQIIDRGPNVPGREFDISKALANRIGLHGTQTIQWRYAR
jgi:rare lipoprotein A (peptidoglycan hydrolase)